MSHEVGISVLIAAYNCEKFIATAINSVLNSSFRDFELIIVDDNSKDRTPHIIRSFLPRDGRIKFYQNTSNLGDYPNRNKAASYAKGKYLKYVDCDDLIYPWGLEALWNCMEKFPNAGWGLCSLAQDKSRIFPFELSPAEAYRYHYLGPKLFHKAPLSSIISRKLFEKAGGFETQRFTGDFELWHRLAVLSPVVLMPHGMVWYRFHDQQESKNVNTEAQNNYLKIERRYLTANETPLCQEELNEIHKAKIKQYQKSLAFALASRNFSLAFSIANEMRSHKPFIKRTS